MDSQQLPKPSVWKRCVISSRFAITTSPLRHHLLAHRHRKLSVNDLFLASYPKSGNTWLRHLLAYLVTKQSTPWRGGINLVSDLVGRHEQLPRVAKNDGRLIKTHEPFRSEYRRAVLLVRDGRDVSVSEYRFQEAYSKHFYLYGNSFETFLRRFLDGRANGYRSWHAHVHSWLDAAEKPENDILVMPFEIFRSDTLGSLRNIVDHIGIETDEQSLQDALADCSVDSMKKKEQNYWQQQGESNRNFVRGGKSGGWRQHFTPELEELFWQHAGSAMQRLGHSRETID